MTGLMHAQQAFLACVLDDTAPAPAGWTTRQMAGLTVYRNAYRARLLDTLRDTFERTARLAGDEAFQQAAAHHLILHPPAHWTIDLAGEGFAETCAALFAGDPDVGELAWLEWAMHRAFAAPDAAPLTLNELAQATAQFSLTNGTLCGSRSCPALPCAPSRTIWSSCGRRSAPQSNRRMSRPCPPRSP